MGTMFETLIGAVVLAVGAIVILSWIFRSFLSICRPNEILIFSGRRHRLPDGRDVGFRVVAGGRGFRIPIVEKVDRMDVSLISVPMQVQGAYSEGGIPLTVHAVANVKVSTNPRIVGNAIERFLGVPTREIGRVAKETMEGHLRGVIASMTPEEVNEDRLKFSRQLELQAEPDLQKLGLALDTLKIQHVADERNYLESIGRQRIAEVLRVAEVAESDAMRAAAEAEAAATARGKVAHTNAEAAIAQKKNELRQIQAELNGTAQSEIEKAKAAGEQARAEAELELQKIRGQLETLRLEADVTIPAETARIVQEINAAGDAAPIAANGEAMAASLELVSQAWRESGGKAMEMFVLQNLDTLFAEVTQAAQRISVDEVNLMDSGDGKMLAAYASAYPAAVAALLREVSSTIGVDIPALIAGRRAPGGLS
ncbi:MAG: flotillin family protein [Myxococcales bacterium]|nr:flotillin family protein [Myxococcales bacterium]